MPPALNRVSKLNITWERCSLLAAVKTFDPLTFAIILHKGCVKSGSQTTKRIFMTVKETGSGGWVIPTIL